MTFIDGAYSHRKDDTSVTAAAQYQRSGRLTKDQITVLRLILENPGMTAGEIAYSYVGFTQVQICRRRKELEQAGMIDYNRDGLGRTISKKTPFEKTGARVYYIKQKGIDFLNQHIGE